MTPSAELKGLLRGAVKWSEARVGYLPRPYIDNAALLLVAGWCEANDRADGTDEAGAIRTAMGWIPDGNFFDDHVPRLEEDEDYDHNNREPYGKPLKVFLSWRAVKGEGDDYTSHHEYGEVWLQRFLNGSAEAWAVAQCTKVEATYRTPFDEWASRIHAPRDVAPLPDELEYQDGETLMNALRERLEWMDNAPRCYLPGALQRIFDLARWDLICHMLGYPPMRLLADA